MTPHFRLFHTYVILVLLALVHCGLMAQEGSLDATFNPGDLGLNMGTGANGNVNCISRGSDGKFIIGGSFSSYNDVTRIRIARLSADGRLDTTFAPTGWPNSPVLASAVQSDGKILIAGEFTQVGGTSRNRIARLNADGGLDTSFAPGTGANNWVKCVAIQPDGKIIIGGWFTSYNGVACGRIARLNVDGTLDATFTPGSGASSSLNAITLQSDGRILIGGDFTTYNGTARGRIARLNVNGSLDATFTSGTGASNSVRSLAVHTDGKVMIGGWFETFNGTTRKRIARLSAAGNLDLSFNPGSGVDDPGNINELPVVNAIAIQSDGEAVIGGIFSQYNGTPRANVARLNEDGSLDMSHAVGADAPLAAMVLLPDEKVVIGGEFMNYGGVARPHLARVNVDGSFDPAFNTAWGASARIICSAVQPDGKILIGGAFTSYNDTPSNRIARLNADGSPDPAFNSGSGANNEIYCIALQPDGRILIGGFFTSYNGTPSNRFARLNSDGSLDASFNTGSGPSDVVLCAAIQPDGRILIGGGFTTCNAAPLARIARLNANGSVDNSFNPGSGADGPVHSISLLPDGRIFLGGGFGYFNGTLRACVARLNVNGGLDNTFSPAPGASFRVYSTCLLADGKVLIAGDFMTYNGTTRRSLARIMPDGSLDASFNPGTGPSEVYQIVVQPDGKIILVGISLRYNGVLRVGITRLNANGSNDTTFDSLTGTGSGGVYTTALQADGEILIGGAFNQYQAIGRSNIARIHGTARAGIKVILEGPFSGGTMTDALRTLPSFPLTEPFTALGYTNAAFTPGASIAPSVLTTTGNNAIADWVIVEMRPIATPNVISTSRAVLLQRDGDVVDLDGVSTIGFAGLADGNYCVAVRSRNHLPVMSSPSTPIAFGGAVANLDFTLPTTLVYDDDARKNMSGVMVLAAGDVTFNGTVSYTGSGNDRDPILTRIGGVVPTNTIGGYWREDVNMDGVVKYTGAANDRDLILQSIGGTVPTNTRVAGLP